MTPTEAIEAMEIIEKLTKKRLSIMSIYRQHKGYIVETHVNARFRHYTAPTLLNALRKAKAAWEEGK